MFLLSQHFECNRMPNSWTKIRTLVLSDISLRHKFAVDEATLTLDSLTEKNGGYEITGKIHVYSSGLFRFKLFLDQQSRIRDYSEELVYEF